MTWRTIGIENLRAGAHLFDSKYYRSAVSRFYYAAFSILTYELTSRHAEGKFSAGRQTPSHAQLVNLIDQYFTQMTEDRRKNLTRNVMDLYRDRLEADYDGSMRIDRASAMESLRVTESIFRYLGVQT